MQHHVSFLGLYKCIYFEASHRAAGKTYPVEGVPRIFCAENKQGANKEITDKSAVKLIS